MKRVLPFLGVLFAGVALAQTNVGGPDTSGPALTAGQYNLIYNFFSFAIAAMGASAIFFFLSRSNVAPKYRVALLISGVVVSIAAYHYVRIFNSFEAAYALNAAGVYAPTTVPFNDAYRYVDWLLTVPLLLVEAVAVLALARGVANSLILRLAVAAVLMIALGYPGEVADNTGTRFLFGTLSTIPFLYILYILWVELARATERQTAEVKVLVRNLRLLLLASWGVYPIAYILPMLGIVGSGAVVGVQVGYTIADVLAKPLFGLLIYAIAVAKTRDDGGVVNEVNAAGAPLPVNAAD
ncbi:bacteriorhodopsin-like [Deinococcus oregonensis]|uniref:Bacteriorhodopsin-like n=1 Tax=Deinococcus oregonensis TaxID=1805970 RepID=A0ABV6B6R5_9DEIO